MFKWIAENIWAVVVIAIFAGFVILALVSVLKKKKKTGFCNGNCAGCSVGCTNRDNSAIPEEDRADTQFHIGG